MNGSDYTPADFGIQCAAMSVDDAAHTAGIGRTLAWRAIKEGRLRVVRYGRRTMVLAPDLARFLSSLS